MTQDKTNIRESYLYFPPFTQNFFTWLTGKAVPKQEPLFIFSRWVHFFVPFIIFIFGVAGNLYFIHFFDNKWVLRILFWIVTVSCIRNLILTIRHECVHNNFVKNNLVNKILGELITIILCTRTSKAYQHDHVSLHHNSDKLCTSSDPHLIYLEQYGITYGVSKQKLWRRLFTILLTPAFYIESTFNRIKANILAQNIIRKIGFFIYVILWSLLIFLTPISFYDFVMAYAFPLFVLSEASAFIEVISEHPVPTNESKIINTIQERRLMLAQKSWCILNGSAFPPPSSNMWVNIYNKTIWFIQMIGHLLVRLTILPGPLPSHELHHRKPGQYDWRIAFYERQKDIDKKCPGYPAYTEVWGIRKALDQVFEGMSSRKPLW